MWLSIGVPILVAVVSTLIPTPAFSDEELVDHVADLNGRIAASVADGREWPKFLDGIASFLFGQESVVGEGVIYYAAELGTDNRSSNWRKVTISKSPYGTWRILSIHECDESEASELVERRDFLRKTSVELFGFDYMRQGPLELLDLLRNCENINWLSPFMSFGWVKESDLPALIELLDSAEPCANVYSILSSHIDDSRSTVGNEAAYLIEGFRKDRYPPRLHSTVPVCDIDEIKAWWERRSGT